MYENLESYQTSNKIVLITTNSLVNTTCSVFISESYEKWLN